MERQGDRIEIRNPGTLASRWSAKPASPNPTIHRLLRRRGLAGKPSCGLDAVTRGLERLGALPFSLVGRDGMVRFVIEMPWRTDQVKRIEHRQEADDDRVVHEGGAILPAMGCEQHGMTVLPATVAICPMASKGLPAVRATLADHAPRPMARTPIPVSRAARVLAPPSGNRMNPAERKAEVLGLFSQRGELTTREVIEALDWTRSTTRVVLESLRGGVRVRSRREVVEVLLALGVPSDRDPPRTVDAVAALVQRTGEASAFARGVG